MVVSLLRNYNLFIIFMVFIIFYAIIYYIVDYPLELQRRKNDKLHKYQSLTITDYFIFSLLTWTTVGDGNGRFASVDWSKETRYINICQGITILLFMSSPNMWVSGKTDRFVAYAEYVLYFTLAVIIYCVFNSITYTINHEKQQQPEVAHISNYS